MEKLSKWYKDYVLLLRSVPSLVMTLFTVSVVLMNLLANKEISLNISWLALDCGITMSWLSFLCMDMLTKRFGAKASIQLSLTAMIINLFVCGVLFLISNIPGNWGAFYTYNDGVANGALNSTIGGTWYVVLGSACAFAASAILNALLNAMIGKAYKKDNFASYALRSYLSTIVAQFADNFIFAFMVSHVFFGWNMLQVVTCSLTGCIVELLCEVIFSPVGYRVCKKWDAENVGAAYLQA
nr:MAG TPA: Putative vitamin uptake transporter [Caudoviricetes sp.]